MLIVYIFFILYCHRQARLCGALLGTSPHTVSSDFSLWGRGVSVCFLCGSLCGLLLAALCGPVLWSAFGPPSSVGRFPFIILSATFILCMSSTASAAVLLHTMYMVCTEQREFQIIVEHASRANTEHRLRFSVIKVFFFFFFFKGLIE